MERVEYKGIEHFEKLVTGGIYEFTPELRELYTSKAISERRFARWCDDHRVGDTYAEYVKALYAFYEELGQKENADKYDREMLEAWRRFNDGGSMAFVPNFDDEDASE